MTVKYIRSFIHRHIGNLLDPCLCPGCHQAIDAQEIFCRGCLQRLTRVDNPCPQCGLENRTLDHSCAVCLYDPPRWQRLVAPLCYQGLTRQLLMQFKFSQALPLATSLVSIVADHYRLGEPLPEVLIPVPLHHRRLMERGYNQAGEIARLLSERVQVPVDSTALTRIKNTNSQSGLSAKQREKNILRAFSFQPRKAYSHVAVIDDIITTGSTANEITKTIHRGGVERVEIWSIARVLK